MISKIVAVLFGMMLSMGIGIWVMIEGWGLEPKSWGAIFTGYFLMLTVSAITQAAARER